MALEDQINNLRGMRYGDQSATISQIQSARQALRLLDASITRTEARLRALPAMVPNPSAGGGGGGGSGGRPTAAQRLQARRGLVKGSAGRLSAGPVMVGKLGLGLNPGMLPMLGGPAVTTALGFHVVAGLSNQFMDLADRQKALTKAGAGQIEKDKQLGLDVIGGVAETFANVTGASGMAKMLLRAGGFTKEDAERRVQETFEKLFTAPEGLRRKQRKLDDAIAEAANQATKQYTEDNAFLDTWTPEDWDVAGDIGRSLLKEEITHKNRAYVDALYDLRSNAGMNKVIMDARGN